MIRIPELLCVAVAFMALFALLWHWVHKVLPCRGSAQLLFPARLNHNPNAVLAFCAVVLAVNFPVVLDCVGKICPIESFHCELLFRC